MPERVTVSNRSEKSAEAVVVIGQVDETKASDEGPNGRECPASCRCDRNCVRCPCEWGERETDAVKLRRCPGATKPVARVMNPGTQGHRC